MSMRGGDLLTGQSLLARARQRVRRCL